MLIGTSVHWEPFYPDVVRWETGLCTLVLAHILLVLRLRDVVVYSRRSFVGYIYEFIVVFIGNALDGVAPQFISKSDNASHIESFYTKVPFFGFLEVMPFIIDDCGGRLFGVFFFTGLRPFL